MSFSNIAFNVLILCIYAACSLYGLVLMKAKDLLSLEFGLGLGLYGLGFLIWIFLILKEMPLSVAFPMAAGTLIIGSQISGWWLLQEKIYTVQVWGVLCILLGIGLIYSVVSK